MFIAAADIYIDTHGVSISFDETIVSYRVQAFQSRRINRDVFAGIVSKKNTLIVVEIHILYNNKPVKHWNAVLVIYAMHNALKFRLVDIIS